MAAPSDNLFVSDLPMGTDDETLKTVFGCYGTVTQAKVLQGGKGNAGLVRYSSVDEAQWVVENVNGNIPEGFTTPVQVKFKDAGGKGKDGGKGGGGGWQNNQQLAIPGQQQGGGKGWGQGGGGQNRSMPYGKGDQNGKGGGKGGKGGYKMKDFVKGLTKQGLLPGGKWTNDDNTLFVSGLGRDCTNEDLYQIFSPFGALAPEGVRAMTDQETGACKGFGFVNFIDPSAAPLAIMTLGGQQLPDGNQLQVSVKSAPSPKGDKGKGKGNMNDGSLF